MPTKEPKVDLIQKKRLTIFDVWRLTHGPKNERLTILDIWRLRHGSQSPFDREDQSVLTRIIGALLGLGKHGHP